MKYSSGYFKEDIPDWKRKKDPFFVKLIFRPLSFYSSALCANLGLTANAVSIFSVGVAVVSCGLFLFNSFASKIIASLLIFFWLLLDCTDGNLARSVKKQPFGEFVDAMSSYVLVGLLGVCIGYRVYKEGGLILESGNALAILLGAVGSSCDSLMRLIYQKFKNTENDLASKGIIEKSRDIRTEHQSVGDFRVRVEQELGLAGILPIMIFVCALTKSLDIVVFYIFAYYGLSFCAASFLYVKKTFKYSSIILKD